MHVAFVVAALGAGGAERVIAQLGSAWAARGWDVTIISFDRSDAPVYHDFGADVRLVRLGVSGRGVRVWTRRLLALRTALRSQRPDVIVSFLTKVNVIALLAASGLQIPIIVSERNNPRMQAASRGWTLMLQRLYPRANGIVVQTWASRECLPPAVLDRAVVIANPIAQRGAGSAASRRDGDDADAGLQSQVRPASGAGVKTMVAVGRLEPQKGFDLLLPAFAAIVTRHHDWQLRIWGEGPEREALARQAASLGITDRVHFAGLSQPLAWIADADAFVLSSRYEGSSNALAEALAAGLPVVSFDCRYGPQEVIEDQVNGLLVPDGDVVALGRAMSRLMGDDALRARLGAAARASMGGRDPNRILAQWDALVSTVTAVAS